jgi:hypothetical protein
MNPKKEEGERARNAGISLEPEIKEKATAFAKASGFKSLSALAHKLLLDALQKAAEAAEEKGAAKQRSAVKKISRARGKK